MTAQLETDLESLLKHRLHTTPADIAQFCQRRNIVEFALFGSVLRDDFRADSDVDVLVVFGPQAQPSLREQLEVQADLEHLFGRKVDVTEKALIKNPFSRVEIGRTHRILYPPEQANLGTPVEVNRQMTNEARTAAALLDMVEALESIQDFVAGRTYDDYATDRMLRRAIERELEILGEAANRVSRGFQTAHGEIDWGQIIGLRNVIIHRYDQIEDERMWAIITTQVPQLLAQVKPLVPPLPEE
jgi:uncharacterized protein with HEPN domain/predicted nucleotidyltransferase